MKYVKIAFLVVVIVAVVVIAPGFSLALPPPVDSGDSGGGDDLSDPIDPGDSAGGGGGDDLSDPIDPGDSAGGGDTTPPPGNGNGGGPSGGSRRNTPSDRSIIQISDIKVMPLGSSIPTTILTIGRTYTISWEASTRNVNTSIDFVPFSLRANIPIGISANPNSNNTLNWTVPTSTAFGSYALVFTDSNGRATVAPNTYTIVNVFGTTSSSPLGIGGGDLSAIGLGTGSSTDSTTPGSTEDPLAGLESEDLDTFSTTQTAAAGNAFTDFLGSKYVLWFFILLLIIAITLLMRERRNRTL